MAGNMTGGKLAAATNKERQGDDFYQKIGAMGGTKSRGGGFGQGEMGHERAVFYGKIGGTMSRRNGQLTTTERDELKQKLYDQYSEALERLTAIQQAARERRAK
jgi:hypothetical protein